MKKLFIFGIISISALGVSTAATQEQEKVVRICWESSCKNIHCGPV